MHSLGLWLGLSERSTSTVEGAVIGYVESRWSSSRVFSYHIRVCTSIMSFIASGSSWFLSGLWCIWSGMYLVLDVSALGRISSGMSLIFDIIRIVIEEAQTYNKLDTSSFGKTISESIVIYIPYTRSERSMRCIWCGMIYTILWLCYTRVSSLHCNAEALGRI